jgi:hypothetical protein
MCASKRSVRFKVGPERRLLFAILSETCRDLAFGGRRAIDAQAWLDSDGVVVSDTGWSFGAVALLLDFNVTWLRRLVIATAVRIAAAKPKRMRSKVVPLIAARNSAYPGLRGDSKRSGPPAGAAPVIMNGGRKNYA